MFRCVRKLFQREVQRLRSILISSQGHAIHCKNKGVVATPKSGVKCLCE